MLVKPIFNKLVCSNDFLRGVDYSFPQIRESVDALHNPSTVRAASDEPSCIHPAHRLSQ